MGAFDGLGTYWITQSGAKTYYSVNLAGLVTSIRTFHPGTGNRGWLPADWALEGTINAANKTYLWGLESKYIFRADLANGRVDSWVAPSQEQAIATISPGFGAAWTFSNGNLGFSNNRTGDILELSVTSPSAAVPTVKFVAEEPATAGPPLGSTIINDGAACIGKPTNLGIARGPIPSPSTRTAT